MDEQNLEMIEFFKQEAGGHILKMNNDLLAVEKEGGNPDLFSKMKREMHTLKGDSRMMGLISISEAAHKIEDLMETLIQKGQFNDPVLLKNIFRALDAIENAVKSLPQKLLDIDLSFIGAGESKKTEMKKQPEVEIFNDDEFDKKVDQVFSKKTETKTAEDVPAEVKKRSKETEDIKESVQETKTEYLNINVAKIDDLIVLSSTFVRYYGRFNYILNRFYQLAMDIVENNSCQNEKLEKNFENIIYDFSENLAFFDISSRQFQDEITSLKLVPLSTIFDLFPRLVRDVAQNTGKEIDFVVEGKDVELDKIIVEKLKTILIHILRNAVDHGCESPEERKKKGKPVKGNVILKAYNRGDNIEIEVSDDGEGINTEKVRLKAIQKGLTTEKKAKTMVDEDIISFIFEPGFSTKEVGTFSGRGVGMDVVATSVKELNGEIKVSTEKNKGTTFNITLPLISSFIPITTVLLKDTLFGIPSSYIKLVLRAKEGDIHKSGDNQKIISLDNLDISLVDLQVLFGVGEGDTGGNKNIVIIKFQDELTGFIVSDILQEKKMVIKKIIGISEKCTSVIGAVLGDMRIIPVLNIPELFRILKSGNVTITKVKEDRKSNRHSWEKNVLLVEDSPITRNLEKKILINHNLNVFEAANGQEALDLLNQKTFDLIISDIEMPVMNGIDLVHHIRERNELAGIPIIIVSSYKAYEQKLAELNINYFINKGDFTTQRLMEILKSEKLLV